MAITRITPLNALFRTVHLYVHGLRFDFLFYILYIHGRFPPSSLAFFRLMLPLPLLLLLLLFSHAYFCAAITQAKLSVLLIVSSAAAFAIISAICVYRGRQHTSHLPSLFSKISVCWRRCALLFQLWLWLWLCQFVIYFYFLYFFNCAGSVWLLGCLAVFVSHFALLSAVRCDDHFSFLTQPLVTVAVATFSNCRSANCFEMSMSGCRLQFAQQFSNSRIPLLLPHSRSRFHLPISAISQQLNGNRPPLNYY